MSAEYDICVYEHKNNVKKACLWLTKNVKIPFEYVPDYWSEELLMSFVNCHDDTKFDPAEYDAYDQYFYGKYSESEAAKREFDRAWLHHLRNNSHHWQHWVLINDDDGIKALDMDLYSVIEMVSDWLSFAVKKNDIYEFLKWYDVHKDKMILSEKTRKLVELIVHKIQNLADAGRTFEE